MRRKKIIKTILRKLGLSELDYKTLKRTPEGCLEMYSRYLPIITAERGIPSDEFIGILDIYFERALRRLPEEISLSYFEKYNSLFDRYTPKDLSRIFEETSEEEDFRDEMDYLEPSDGELSRLEASLA